jgi:hypothetical protein
VEIVKTTRNNWRGERRIFQGGFWRKKNDKIFVFAILKTCLKNRFIGIWRGTARSHHREYKEHREREEDRQGYYSTNVLMLEEASFGGCSSAAMTTPVCKQQAGLSLKIFPSSAAS